MAVPTHKEGVLPELPCPHQLEPSNHTREPSLRVLYVPIFLVSILSYTFMF
jgi:hypothetical protein